MALRSLTLRNFRNHELSNFSFSQAITVITGKNGVGKTSILESVSLLGTGKSFRQAKLIDFVRFHEKSAALRAEVNHNGLESVLSFEITEGRRKIEINGKSIKLLRHLHAILPCVAFSPSDHKIIDGDASDRRFFLNHALGTFDYEYADALSEFNRALAQRNKLLKLFTQQSYTLSRLEGELEAWDDLLSRSAITLMNKRSEYCRILSDTAQQEYSTIARNIDSLQLFYKASVDQIFLGGEKSPTEQIKIMRQAWKDSLRLDLAAGATFLGPHKDDLRLTLGGNEAKFYGSQGEKKTAVLALRLAEVTLLKTKQNLRPVLLVDDVSSELDSDRRRALVELLRREDQQVLMTATEMPSTLVGAVEHHYEHIDLKNLGAVTL